MSRPHTGSAARDAASDSRGADVAPQGGGAGTRGSHADAGSRGAGTAASPAQAPEPVGEELRAAEEIFGDRLDLARRYVGHLSDSGIERGLIGPREVPRLWVRHVLNCAVVQELIPQGASVVDVGSGAGLPGLCLALARPDLSLTLVEPLERRVIWLDEVVRDLELGDSVRILRGRGEQIVGEVEADIVTARAVSALGGLLDITLPILRGTGQLLALKGRSAEEEVRKARKKLSKYGARETEILTVGDRLLSEPTTVVRVSL